MEYSSLTFDNFSLCLQPLRSQVNHAVLNQRQAAILTPVAHRPQLGLLLAQRSVHLYKHTGQTVFPGRVMDGGDVSSVIAALREVQEEVAIPLPCVEAIDVLPPVDSVTGFQIALMVGVIPPNLPHRASEDEASAVFEMLLIQALHLGRYHLLDIYRHGDSHRVWPSWYE